MRTLDFEKPMNEDEHRSRVAVWILIIGFSCLTACKKPQEMSQQVVVNQANVTESCDFEQFNPLRGDFDMHPNPNDRISTPKYPDEARKARIEGVVRLKVLVNGSGLTERVCVQSGDSRLVRSAVEAVQSSQFAPLLLNNKPVPYFERTLHFSYALSENR